METNNHSFAKSTNDFKAGERVEVSVTGLEGDQYYEPCVIKEVRNNGYIVMCSGTEYSVQKGWVRRPKEDAQPKARNNQQTVQNNGGDDGTPAKQTEDDDEAVNDNCDFDPPAAKVSNSDKFSSALAKRKIYDKYKLGETGGVTAPLKIGVTFLSFQVGKSFINTARDGFRINDAAPVNAVIYPVASKHIVCEEYRRNTIMRRQVEVKHDCFKDRDGSWVCGISGVPKITQLQ
jgi:hypothetical protein